MKRRLKFIVTVTVKDYADKKALSCDLVELKQMMGVGIIGTNGSIEVTSVRKVKNMTEESGERSGV